MFITSFGYVGFIKNKRNFIKIYLILVSIVALAILFCCISYFYLTGEIPEYIDNNWPKIQLKLL